MTEPTAAGPCQEWTGSQNGDGYGIVTIEGRNAYAHRVAWRMAGREIPRGLQIDHLCRNRACIRVDHMEVVSSRENTLRGFGPTALNARRTTCREGHPLDGLRGRYRRRYCKTCHRATYHRTKDLAARRARERVTRQQARAALAEVEK